LIRLKTFPAFTAKYKTVFTLGLTFSSAVDVIITFGMCFYLQGSRRGFGTMDDVIDSIIIYTINNGTLTCISTIVSLICWLTMPHNLIFMALHFAIAKMYANSLFATLNMRRSFRGRAVPPKETVEPMPVLFPDSFNRNQQGEQTRGGSLDFTTDQLETKRVRSLTLISERRDLTTTSCLQLHITVEQTVQYDGQRESGPSPKNTDGSFELKEAPV
jgi:hypothetical protein